MLIDPEGHEITALIARLPDASATSVVEIGCGDGRLTRRYCHRVASVLAIDPDEAAVAAFREAGVPPNVTLHAGPVNNLELTTGTADVVLFSWAL